MQTLEKWPNFTPGYSSTLDNFVTPKLHPSLAAGFRERWGVPSSHASESDPAAQSSNGKKQNNHRFTMAAVLKETAVAVKVRTVMRLERFGKQFRIQNNLALQKHPNTQFVRHRVGSKSENLVYAQAFTFSLSISSKHSQSGTYSLWCYSGVT